MELDSVTIFLDESIHPAKTNLTFVGAAAVLDPPEAEGKIVEKFQELSIEQHRWRDLKKFEEFRAAGFHFTADNEDIRKSFIDVLANIEYRSHIVYSGNPYSLDEVDLLINLYFHLLKGIIQRYENYEVTLVFEQNQKMDKLYRPLVAKLQEELVSAGVTVSITVLRGKKSDPILAIPDYVMGLAAARLADDSTDYKRVRFTDVARDLAHIMDFDAGRHSKRGKLD